MFCHLAGSACRRSSHKGHFASPSLRCRRRRFNFTRTTAGRCHHDKLEQLIEPRPLALRLTLCERFLATRSPGWPCLCPA